MDNRCRLFNTPKSLKTTSSVLSIILINLCIELLIFMINVIQLSK